MWLWPLPWQYQAGHQQQQEYDIEPVGLQMTLYKTIEHWDDEVGQTCDQKEIWQGFDIKAGQEIGVSYSNKQDEWYRSQEADRECGK